MLHSSQDKHLTQSRTVQQVAVDKINPGLLNNRWKAEWITQKIEL